jgi:hypothetical protein
VTTTGPAGGFTRRAHPASGMRPTVRFVLACLLTAGWVGFGIWASEPWRHDLEQAINPVAAWVIPVLLAYIPGVGDRVHGCHPDREPAPRASA